MLTMTAQLFSSQESGRYAMVTRRLGLAWFCILLSVSAKNAKEAASNVPRGRCLKGADCSQHKTTALWLMQKFTDSREINMKEEVEDEFGKASVGEGVEKKKVEDEFGEASVEEPKSSPSVLLEIWQNRNSAFAKNEIKKNNNGSAVQLKLRNQKSERSSWHSPYTTMETGFISLSQFPSIIQQSNLPPTKRCMLLPEDRKLLFSLGFASAGPVLELGSFCGCSAIEIARGMERRRGEENRAERFAFFTSDMFPAPPGTKSPHRFEIDQSSKTVQLLLWDKPQYAEPISLADWEPGFGEASRQPGGMLHCLYQNLWEAGGKDMMDSVSIVANGADHVPKIPWRAIFSDTAHDLRLVNITRHAWEHALGKGHPVLMLFHDIGLSQHRMQYLSTYYRAQETLRGYMMFGIEVPANWTAPFLFNPGKI